MDIKLPDFDDMEKVIDSIQEALYTKLSIDKAIELRESEIAKIVTTNTDYFVNGKQPSMDYIKTAYFPGGLEGELKELRTAYVKAVVDLKRAELTFDMMKSMIDVWRTNEANGRKALL